MPLCDYGCGREAIHQFKNGKWCCEKYSCKCPVIREINSNKNTGRKLSDETINKIRIKATGRQHTQKTKDKISKINKEREVPKGCLESLKKIHKNQVGKPSGNKGKKRSKDAIRKTSKLNKGKKRTPEQIDNITKGIQKGIKKAIKKWGARYKNGSPLKGTKLSEEHKKKLSKAKKGKPSPKKGKPGHIPNEKTRLKMRKSYLKKLKENIGMGGQIFPFFNPDACKLIDEYGEKHGYNFQHAMNGGEYKIEELGYWVDGYDVERNTVIEVDEKHHFDIDGNLSEKDIRRQKEIEEYMGCDFIRLTI